MWKIISLNVSKTFFATTHKIFYCLVISILLTNTSHHKNINRLRHSIEDKLSNNLEHRQLIFLYSIIREGLSSPIKLSENITDLFGNDWPEGRFQLTSIGQRQSFLLGLHYRERLFNFISDIFNPEEISLYSTNKKRSKQSLQSFAQGLFFQNKSNKTVLLKEKQIRRAIPPVKLSPSIKTKITNLNTSVLNYNTTVIPLHTLRPDSLYDLLSSGKKCIGIDEYWEMYYFEAYTLLKNFRTKWRQFFIDFMSDDLELGEHCYHNVLSFCDVLTTSIKAGKNLTLLEKYEVDIKDLNESCIEFMSKDKFLFRFGKTNNYFLARMTSSLVLKEILNKLNTKTTTQRFKDLLNNKAIIFNCHTNLITAILSTLKFTFRDMDNVKIEEFIGPAYSLDFILYRQVTEKGINEYFVMIELNDIEILKIEYTKFVKSIENVLISEVKIEDFCKIRINKTSFRVNDLIISIFILSSFILATLIILIYLKLKIRKKKIQDEKRINYFN